MSKYKYILITAVLLIILAGARFAGLTEVASAQFAIWFPNANDQAELVDSTWGMKVPGLGGGANVCLTSDASGVFGTTTCAAGGSVDQLGQVGDVNTTTLASQDMLAWTGSEWVSSSTPSLIPQTTDDLPAGSTNKYTPWIYNTGWSKWYFPADALFGTNGNANAHIESAPTAGKPAYGFYGDIDTGMYRHGINTLGLYGGGTTAMTLSSTVVNIPLTLSVTGTSTLQGGIKDTDGIELNTGAYSALFDADALTAVRTLTMPDSDVDLTPYNNLVNFFNGTFAEKFDAIATSTDGTTVQVSLTEQGGGDLTARFSTGHQTIDVTPASTTDLTVGSDASPTDNYVYIPRSTGAITVSTSDWPAEEHVKIGYFLVPSAAFVQSSGAYVNQNWNDAADDSTGQGHLTHMTERMRRDGAYYGSGIDGNGTDGYLTPTAGNVEYKATAGVIYQMHPHTYVAKDTSAGDIVLVKNWSGDPYHDITNLHDITADSTGSAIANNKYFNLVVWGVANKGGEFGPVMINLPSGSYNSLADATSDVSGYDDFSIPSQFNGESSNGFLIARITIQMGATWSVEQTTDLRGTTPATAGGGVTGTQVEYADNTFRIFDETDVTKELAFEASSITTGNTRTITVPDADGTMALTSDLSDYLSLASWYATTSAPHLTSLPNLTTVGTIGTGVWNGTAIDISSYTNLVAGTNITLSGDTLNVDDAFLANDGDVGTGAFDFGGADSLEMVNAAGPTLNATGEFGLDTTDNQFRIYDGTADRVYAREHHRIFAVTIASTSVEFVSGGVIPIPPERDGYELTEFHCYVDGGTSVVVNISDGTNDTETITCATTLTTDTDVATNDTATAGELMEIQIGTITGTPDYLTFMAYGHITTE